MLLSGHFKQFGPSAINQDTLLYRALVKEAAEVRPGLSVEMYLVASLVHDDFGSIVMMDDYIEPRRMKFRRKLVSTSGVSSKQVLLAEVTLLTIIQVASVLHFKEMERRDIHELSRSFPMNFYACYQLLIGNMMTILLYEWIHKWPGALLISGVCDTVGC